MDRARKIREVLLWVLILNWLVAAAKLAVGYFIKSNSMVADGFHSFSDGSSNIAGLIGIWFASRPVDESHPYGHKKYETFTAIGIAMLLLLVSFGLFQDSLSRLRNPMVPNVNVLSFAVMGVTMAINLIVMVYEYKQGKLLHSDILVSDSLHTRADILTSLSVICALVAVKLGYPIFDTVISALIALFIAYAAYDILRDAARILCDTSAIDVKKIEAIVNKVDGVTQCHKIRTRGRPDDVHMDLHVVVKPTMQVEAAHELSHRIEKAIKESCPEVTDIVVHLEPGVC